MRYHTLNLDDLGEIKLDRYWNKKKYEYHSDGLAYGASNVDASNVARIQAQMRQHAASVLGDEVAGLLRFRQIRTPQRGYLLTIPVADLGKCNLFSETDKNSED